MKFLCRKWLSKSWLKITVKTLIRVVAAALIVFVTILLVYAFNARKQPDLQVWHEVKLSNEFGRKQYTPQMTFDQYRVIEDKVFDELDRKIISRLDGSEKEEFNRYNRLSLSSPDRFEKNWNRSFELIPERIEGGVLLIHGLSDSPYSMKATAEVFHKAGFYVLSLRMPGHGTVPSSLAQTSWKDWMAAVRVGVRHVKQKAGSEQPFYIAGYSNGGALGLLYTLESLDDADYTRPDRVFLFSPAIGITKFASMAHWLKMASVIRYFEKTKWTKIVPEYDPFKYNSFPINAAIQSYNLAVEVQEGVLDCHEEGVLGELPPVVTFQSLVDSTVIAKDVVTKFYDKLSPNGHELVVFDVNRRTYLKNFLKKKPFDLNGSRKFDYGFTLITNKDEKSNDVVARNREANTTTVKELPLNMSWPESVYSLSHVALPFSAKDSLYGMYSQEDSSRLQLGKIYIRGEKNALWVGEDDLMRIRCNPFWGYVVDRINKAIELDRKKRL